MGFLDRFKKQKEQETAGKSAAVVGAEKKNEKSPALIKKNEEKKVSLLKGVEKEKNTKSSKKIVSQELSNVLFRPLVTEKSATLTSLGQYVFEINPKANRIQVAAAIKAIYGINPAKVMIQNVRREAVRFGRFHGKKKAWKKAIVCLPKGKTINVHEGI